MRGVRVLFLIVVMGLMVAAPASGDAPLGSDPANNFPLGGMPEACASEPDGAVCQNAAIHYLDGARASLGQSAYPLPSDFTSLSPADRDLILTDLDRTLYGLPAIPGLTAALDVDAANGVTVDDDPRSSDPLFSDYASNWAGAWVRVHMARCAVSVTYRHLTGGRYQLTVVSVKTSAARIVLLRRGVSTAASQHPARRAVQRRA